MVYKGKKVSPPTHTDHDRIIDEIKTEIKFSLAVSEGDKIIKDKFIINHVALKKDWDRLLFCGINPDQQWNNLKIRKNDYMPYGKMIVNFMEKTDFIKYMKSKESNKVFKHQQSGEKGGNDDYICTNFHKLISLPFVKHIDEW